MIQNNRSRFRLWRRQCAIVGVFLVLSCLVFPSSTRADSLVTLVPTPSSSAFSAFTFGGSTPSFSTGPGSVGNGDGALPVISQTPGGLELQTPFYIFPLTFGQQINADGSTFYDTTLVLSGLAASGAATQYTIPLPFGNEVFDSQVLSNGTFAIYGSVNVPGGYGADPSAAQLLLSGDLANNEIYGADGSSSAAVFSTQVTYTGGSIYTALIDNGGSASDDASFNLSLIGSSPLEINGSSGYLNSFSANGTVLLDATGFTVPTLVPEPSSIVLLVVGLLVLAATTYRRRRLATGFSS